MVSQAKKSRRSSTTAIPATPAAAVSHGAAGEEEGNKTSPESASQQVAQVLAQHLGKHISQEDLLRYRLVCKEWSKGLPAGRKTVLIENPGSASLAYMPSVFEAADSAVFIVSERLSALEVQPNLSSLFSEGFGARVKHVTFTSTSPQGSKLSAWPSAIPFWPLLLTELKGLESLTFIGRAPQTALFSDMVQACSCLTSLVLGLHPGEQLTPLSEATSRRLTLRRSSLQYLSALTSLRRLAMELDDVIWLDDEPMASTYARMLAGLTGLTELRLAGGAVSIEIARMILRPLQNLHHVSLTFSGHGGRLYERTDRALWKRMESVELLIKFRVLEGDLQLLTLGLATNLRALHLKAVTVSPYSITALSALTALRELTIISWTPVGPEGPAVDLPEPALENDPNAAAAVKTVRAALVELLAGSLGRQLEVLRMDMAGPSRDICGEMACIARSSWSHGSQLRVLQLVNVSAYSLSSTGALACLAQITSLQELRVTIKDLPCDGCTLHAAWLPPNLSSLELVGVHLPCPEEEDRHAGAAPARPGPPASTARLPSLPPPSAAEPAQVAAGLGDTNGCQKMQPLVQQQCQEPVSGPVGEGQEKPLPEGSGSGWGQGRRRMRASSRPPISLAPSLAGAVAADAGSSGGEEGPSCAGTAAAEGPASASGLYAAAAVGAGGACRQAEAGSTGVPCLGHARLRKLKRLSLRGCKYGCCGHLQAALGPSLMPGLVSLELDDVMGLQEKHLAGLAALKGLTSLSVCALSQPDIGSSSLVHVSGLTELRRLRWHAGDSLDAPPHPAVLQPLRRLLVFDVSSGQWSRMSRWHVASAVAEALPLCELAAN